MVRLRFYRFPTRTSGETLVLYRHPSLLPARTARPPHLAAGPKETDSICSKYPRCTQLFLNTHKLPACHARPALEGVVGTDVISGRFAHWEVPTHLWPEGGFSTTQDRGPGTTVQSLQIPQHTWP